MKKVARKKPAAGSGSIRYVAWLRAINVGGHVVKMDALRRAFESLGFANVQTFIASGNVIFESPSNKADDLERAIEARLAKTLGYPVTTFVRTSTEVVRIAAHAAFAPSELENGASLYVIFFKSEFRPEVRRKVMALRTELDDFDVHRREVYWLRRRAKERPGEPGPPLEKTLGGQGTSRNITTVRKLAAKYCAEQAADF